MGTTSALRMRLTNRTLGSVYGIGEHELHRQLPAAGTGFYFFEYQLQVAEFPGLEHWLIAYFVPAP